MYIYRIYKHIIITYGDIKDVFTAINWTRVFDFQWIGISNSNTIEQKDKISFFHSVIDSKIQISSLNM